MELSQVRPWSPATIANAEDNGVTPVPRVEVRSFEEKATIGEQLKRREARHAHGTDQHRIAAETLFSQAEQLRSNGEEASSRKAIELYKEALSFWKQTPYRADEAQTLKHIGDIYRSFHELNDALVYYRRAHALYRGIKDLRGECETLTEITFVYSELGKNEAALKAVLRALKQARSIGDRALEARALNYRAEISYWSGELAKASDLHRSALRLWIEIEDRRGQAETYTYLGQIASDLAQVKESFNFYRQALELWRAIPDRLGEAVTLSAAGRLYSRIGESQQALDSFEKAMPIIDRSGNMLESARVLTGMAHVYAKVGEEHKGIDYYQRALTLFKLAHHPNGEAATLYSVGRIYYSIDEKTKALESQLQALEICRALGDRRLEILVLVEIGRLYDFAGDKPAALKNFLLARSFAQSQKDLRAEMDIWNLLGNTYDSQGKKQVALECYKRALALSRKAEHRFGETATLYLIAQAHFTSGDLPSARLHTEEAIHLIESLRTKVNSLELRASYFASVRQLYELYIDVLMELHSQDRNGGYDVLAFEASERARGRSLLEMVATARVGVREKVDPELLARERELREELSTKAEQRMLHSVSSREADRSVVDRELDDLTSRYQEVRAQIRAVSLEHADQTEPRPLGLHEIRERDLTDDSALLEFSLGERRSYLWFVTKDSFKSFALPPRREIEQSALAIRKLLVPPPTMPGESLEEFNTRSTAAEAEYWQKAADFSETLLGPIAGDLGTKRLLIVADGALQYLPFGALPVPSREEVTPLMMEHEISFQPSASVLAMLRSRATKPHGKAIAVFADPVFELDDSRFAKNPKSLVAAVRPREDPLERALRDANLSWGNGSIPRLLASREEAEAIMNLVPVAGNLKAVDFDANKAAATTLDLSQYQILHIATHGVLDSRRPELSGLLLSRFDKDGRHKEGVLRLDDIFNLNLSAAMVVLSACNTGLGKDVRGEGLVGLVHGFMYAGTSRVVASLWKVDDDATAQLMVHFYSEMFRSGKSPAAALRAAQIAMWQQKRWRAPYFWAAFVLHGDYEGRVDDLHIQSSTRIWQVGAIVIVGIASGIFFLKRKLRKQR